MCQPKFSPDTPDEGEAHQYQSKKRKAPSTSTNRTRVLSLEELQDNFHLPINEVACKLGVCVTVLKQQCRELGIVRWPYRKVRKLDNMLTALESSGPSKARPFALTNGEEERQKKIGVVKQTLRELMTDPNSSAHLKLGKVKNAGSVAAAATATATGEPAKAILERLEDAEGSSEEGPTSGSSIRKSFPSFPGETSTSVAAKGAGAVSAALLTAALPQLSGSPASQGDGSSVVEAARALVWGANTPPLPRSSSSRLVHYLVAKDEDTDGPGEGMDRGRHEDGTGFGSGVHGTGRASGEGVSLLFSLHGASAFTPLPRHSGGSKNLAGSGFNACNSSSISSDEGCPAKGDATSLMLSLEPAPAPLRSLAEASLSKESPCRRSPPLDESMHGKDSRSESFELDLISSLEKREVVVEETIRRTSSSERRSKEAVRGDSKRRSPPPRGASPPPRQVMKSPVPLGSTMLGLASAKLPHPEESKVELARNADKAHVSVTGLESALPAALGKESLHLPDRKAAQLNDGRTPPETVLPAAKGSFLASLPGLVPVMPPTLMSSEDLLQLRERFAQQQRLFALMGYAPVPFIGAPPFAGIATQPFAHGMLPALMSSETSMLASKQWS